MKPGWKEALVLGTAACFLTLGEEQRQTSPANDLPLPPQGPNLLAQGTFDAGLGRWTLWTRQPGAGRASWEAGGGRGGSGAARIEISGERDWSFSPGRRAAVRPGEIWLLRCWVRIEGWARAVLGATARDRRGKTTDWSLGAQTIFGPTDWAECQSWILVPPNTASIEPRLTGKGKGRLWVDDVEARRCGRAETLRAGLPQALELTNGLLRVKFFTDRGALEVEDLRCGKLWRQEAPDARLTALKASQKGGSIWATLLDARAAACFEASIRPVPGRPEIEVALEGKGPLQTAVCYPHPFLTKTNSWLVIPLNEGIGYPAGDPSIRPMRLIAYGGHGICMAFWGATEGEAGQMAIIETPDDAAIRIRRLRGRLCVAPEWDPQRHRFGYARRLRYVFFERGGHVAMAKRYRAYAKRLGRLKTLAQKRDENPNTDLLVGAVNVWCWDPDPVGIVREMQEAGIRRILWSHRADPQTVRRLNRLGVLTSRYDIYQDVMDPALFPKLRGVHPDWPSEVWPEGIMLDEFGRPRQGWRVRDKEGKWRACGVVCDKVAVRIAARRIPAELKTHPYRCRFIDTATASPWRECYAPAHPMTRSESRLWKMRLLDFVSGKMGLVCGSETGHDAAAPYVHYFEGMLSLGPYRVPDAGRDIGRIWTEVPERTAKFQVGQFYRLPLWELVYHDCVVAQWYWGDYNNKLLPIWDKKDLFNALYATPPMFMFTRRFWREHKERFVRSYRAVAPVVRAAGWSEMTDHRILTPDRNVQQTVFSNGLRVTVNFDSRPRRLPDGRTVPPMEFLVDGLKKSKAGNGS